MRSKHKIIKLQVAINAVSEQKVAEIQKKKKKKPTPNPTRYCFRDFPVPSKRVCS